MAHSYDQTLLQRMGFADPDRRSPAHDDACVQIATEPERFIRAVRERLGVREARCDLEVPLQKGEGKYASTVGFIDAMVMWTNASEQAPVPRYSSRRVGRYDEKFWMATGMLVEVKTSIDGIGNLLRQMNLYREYKKTHSAIFVDEKGATHKQDDGSQFTYETYVDDYVIWSLNPTDSKYTKLLSQQGYHLIAGPLP